MTVLVTGARGQLGAAVCAQLAEAGQGYVGLGSAELDIGDGAAVASAVASGSYTAIINCAAYTAVDKAESEPETAYRVNRDGAGNLAVAAQQTGLPLLHVSTDYVFDGSKPGGYQPGDATNPLGVYGASKLAGEQAIAASGCRYLIVRTAWVFGEHGNNFVKTMLRLGAEREQLGVVADQIGSPTYTGDLAAVLIGAAQKMAASWSAELDNQLFHYGGTPSCSWHQFAEAIFTEAVAAGVLTKAPLVNAITTTDYPTPAQRPACSILPYQPLTQLLGLVEPQWRRGLVRYLAAT